ncbi:MAG: PLDc N-terminal domain-containing protein [Chloroflexi bacterium]|nr:PLDc N-terminal domain-containing protein [Chloroflexota bacterium]
MTPTFPFDMTGFLSVFLIFALLMLLGPIIALIDLFQRSDRDVAGDSRVLWAIVVLLVPFAWIVYFVVGRRPRLP